MFIYLMFRIKWNRSIVFHEYSILILYILNMRSLIKNVKDKKQDG